MQRLGYSDRSKEIRAIECVVEIVGDFIAAHSAPVTLRDRIVCVRVVQPALHCELEESPSPKSCENQNNASVPKPSATSVVALAEKDSRSVGFWFYNDVFFLLKL